MGGYEPFQPCRNVMLLPLQGANFFYTILPTQGVASLALGYVLRWAFSPPLLNPKLEFLFIAEVPRTLSNGTANRAQFALT